MGVVGPRHIPAAVPPGKRPCTHCVGGWVRTQTIGTVGNENFSDSNTPVWNVSRCTKATDEFSVDRPSTFPSIFYTCALANWPMFFSNTPTIMFTRIIIVIKLAKRFGLVGMRRSAVYRNRAVGRKQKAWGAVRWAGINAEF